MAKKIALIAGLALIVVALILTLFLLRDDGGSITVEEDTTSYILNIAAADIESVTVKNESGEFTVLPGTGAAPVLQGFEDFPADTAALQSLLNTAGRLVSQGIVLEDVADLAPFGLADSRAVVRVIQSGGNGDAVFLIGADAPDGSNVYVLSAGTVQLADKAYLAPCLNRTLDFLDRSITPQAAEERAFPVFEEIVLGGAVRGGEPVIITARPEDDAHLRTLAEDATSKVGLAPNPYRIKSPVEAALPMDGGIGIIQSVFGLTASRIVARFDVAGGNAALAQYGLAEPYSTLAAVLPGEGGLFRRGFSLRVSAPNEAGMVCIQKEGINLIYEAPASALPWLEVSFFTLMEKLVVMPYIGDVAAVEIRSPERTVSFILSGDGETLAVAAEGSGIPNGSAVNPAQFRIFYQTLLLAKYDEYSEEPLPRGMAPALEITYIYRDGKKADRVSFFPVSSRRLLTSLNGERPFYTYTVYADKVLADIGLLLRGEAVAPYL